MADLYPFANGSWSTASNWYDAGTGLTVNRLPNSGGNTDNVWLNNKTITLDTNATCNKLSNKPFTGAVFSPVAGGSVTVALTNVFYPTITIGSGGIEASLSTAGNVISVSGSSTTGTTSSFQILCSGDITGGSGTTSNAIIFTCTNTKITITANNITGGTGGAAIYPNAAGNTIYINCTNLISGNTYSGIFTGSNYTTGSMYIYASTISGGSSLPAISISANNSNTQYIGYTYNFSTSQSTVSAISNITSSSTSPAIQTYTGTAGVQYFNTTLVLINATNVNSNTNGYFPIQVFNFRLESAGTTINIPDLSSTLKSYSFGATNITIAQAVWGYLTTNTEFSTTNAVAKLIKDNLNATVSSRAVAGDAMTLTPGERTTVASSVWNSATRSLTTFGTLIADIWAYLTASATTAGSIGKRISDNLDTTVGSRLATSGYTAPDNSSISAIKAKTDNLPSDPASNTQVNTRLDSASYTAPDNATISTINTNVSAVKTATDRIPTNPASIESTGGQIAGLT